MLNPHPNDRTQNNLRADHAVQRCSEWSQGAHALPFVDSSQGSIRYWVAHSSIDRQVAPAVCETRKALEWDDVGQSWANDFQELLKDSGQRGILCRIVRDIDLNDPRGRAFLLALEDKLAKVS